MRRLILTTTLLALVCLLPVKGWAEVVQWPLAWYPPDDPGIVNKITVNLVYREYPEVVLFPEDVVFDKYSSGRRFIRTFPEQKKVEDPVYLHLTNGVDEALVAKFDTDGFSQENIEVWESDVFGALAGADGIDLEGLALTRTAIRADHVRIDTFYLPGTFPVVYSALEFDGSFDFIIGAPELPGTLSLLLRD